MVALPAGAAGPVEGADVDTPRHARPAPRRGFGACLALSAASGLGMVALAGGVSSAAEARQAITITARQGATSVSGAEALSSGLTRVTFRNASRKDAFVALARLRPGVSVETLRARLNRSAALPDRLIAIPASAFTGPGESSVTTVSLPPGEYVATQPPDGKGLGPATTFTVGGGAAGGTPPRATSSITMYDFGFRVPRAIDGDGTVAVRNIGASPHFIIGIRLNRAADAGRVVRALRSGQELQGPPPGRFVSILGIVTPGTTNYVRPQLQPGRYVIACFYSDRHSAGHEHTDFGMVRAVTVR